MRFDIRKERNMKDEGERGRLGFSFFISLFLLSREFRSTERNHLVENAEIHFGIDELIFQLSKVLVQIRWVLKPFRF